MAGRQCRAPRKATVRSPRHAPTRSAFEAGPMRTKREFVTFDRPFALGAIDGVQPAGTYAVDVDEELIEGLSFLAYRRVGTTTFLPLRRGGASSVQAVRVEPGELTAA